MPGPWKEEDPTTPSSPPDVPTDGARTAKERCRRCGERAAGRCSACGDAFCKVCIDPAAKSAPDVRCRECVRKLDASAKGCVPVLLEQILERCLMALARREVTPLVRAMRNEVVACQQAIDAWRAELPSTEVRAAMRERVLTLHGRITGDAS